MTNERRRELSEKLREAVLANKWSAPIIESAFLEIEREVREDAIEECASIVWDGTEPPPDTWINAQTGKPAFDPIQVNRMFLAQRLRSLIQEGK